MFSTRVALAAALAAVSLAGCGLPQSTYATLATSNEATVGAKSVPGQLIVKYKAGSRLQARVLRDNSALGMSLVQPAAGQTTEQLAAQLAADPSVEWVDRNWVIDAPRPSGRRHTAPSLGFDLKPNQWHHGNIQDNAAWSTTKGKGVTVAVIDTGIDPNHPNLKAQLVPGFNSLENNNDPTDDNGHGTHVAGIIAATNGSGVVGVAPEAKIMPIRALGEQGGSAQSVAAAIQFAVDHGANVINMSLGSPAPSKAIKTACDYALKKGVSLVVAMGNDGDQGNPKQYPASYPGVIAVGALDPSNEVTSWSDFGTWEAVSAPGYGIWSTFPTYECSLSKLAKQHPDALPPEDKIQLGYSAISGTSQASPVVAGVVALMRAANPRMTPAQVRSTLMSTAKDLGPSGFDPHYGAGIVDAAAAVAGK